MSSCFLNWILLSLLINKAKCQSSAIHVIDNEFTDPVDENNEFPFDIIPAQPSAGVFFGESGWFAYAQTDNKNAFTPNNNERPIDDKSYHGPYTITAETEQINSWLRRRFKCKSQSNLHIYFAVIFCARSESNSATNVQLMDIGEQDQRERRVRLKNIVNDDEYLFNDVHFKFGQICFPISNKWINFTMEKTLGVVESETSWGFSIKIHFDPDYDNEFAYIYDITIDCISTPTQSPTNIPTATPTAAPTTAQPTHAPTTAQPTQTPTDAPTKQPTNPTSNPTSDPTSTPTDDPTKNPTVDPTHDPTKGPTPFPTAAPTFTPTSAPSTSPTLSPTDAPTESPTPEPTPEPSFSPTPKPTPKPNIDSGSNIKPKTNPPTTAQSTTSTLSSTTNETTSEGFDLNIILYASLGVGGLGAFILFASFIQYMAAKQISESRDMRDRITDAFIEDVNEEIVELDQQSQMEMQKFEQNAKRELEKLQQLQQTQHSRLTDEIELEPLDPEDLSNL